MPKNNLLIKALEIIDSFNSEVTIEDELEEYNQYIREHSNLYMTKEDYNRYGFSISDEEYINFGKYVKKDYFKDRNTSLIKNYINSIIREQDFYNYWDFSKEKAKRLENIKDMLIDEYYKMYPKTVITKKELLDELMSYIDSFENKDNNEINNNKYKLIEKSNKIVSNDEYIIWLKKVISNPKNKILLMRDYKNTKLKNLKYLFIGIGMYCIDNNIPICQDRYRHYYKIKYDDLGYNIGYMDTICFRDYFLEKNRITDDFVDFNDILGACKDKNNKIKQLKK